jgi:hypothetical protein
VFMRAPKSIRNTTALFKHMSFLMIPDAHELANGVGPFMVELNYPFHLFGATFFLNTSSHSEETMAGLIILGD